MSDRAAVLKQAMDVCNDIWAKYEGKHSQFAFDRRGGKPFGQWENEESPIWYKAKAHGAYECRRAIQEMIDE
jgi:hypothetical protein